jgi:DNA-binding CsgD family transcriptional regulator
VLCAARATPYELLELAFDHAREAQDAYAWLGRLAVVETTARGLAPHLRFRDQCARRLARAEPALWAHAQAVVRELTAHRITVAPDPAPWVLDRLYVDRELAAVRAHVTLPTSDPGLVLERGAPEEVAAVIGAAGGPAAADLPASALARWLATDRAELDLVRDARGALVGYACCVAVTAAAPLDDPDPPLALAGRHLQAVDWFGAATPPDARALVVRCLRTLGASGAPAARALLLAQLAGRVLTQPTLEVLFIVASEPAPAIALLRFAGLAPHAVGEVGRGPARRAVIAADLRGLAPGPGLERAAAAAAAAAPARPAPAQRPSPAVPPPPAPPAPPDLGEAIARRLGELAARAGLSPREQEVLSLLLLGRNAAEIGTALAIAPRTARFHQANALAKVGAESRLDVLRLLM